MAVKLGSGAVTKLYRGSTAVQKAYLGSTLVFSSGPVGPGAPLDYDGLMPTITPADLPYNVSQHISGPGTPAYSGTGFPVGVTINPSSGILDDTGTFTGDTIGAITVSNGELPNVTITFDFDGGGGGGGGSVFAETSNAFVNTSPLAAAAIGAADVDRVVYVPTYVGGASVTTCGLTIGGVAATLVGNYLNANRACEWWSRAIPTGTTVALDRAASGGGSDGRTGAFRVAGYQPIATTPVVGNRQEPVNLTNSAITATVPAGGCILLATKNYETITPSTGSLVGVLSSANDRVAVWHNAGGSPVSVTFTASTVTSVGQKYIFGCIMELI